MENKRFTLTEFARSKVWDRDLAGTTISDRTPSEFEAYINDPDIDPFLIRNGYADFCKLFVFKNWTDARPGTVEIGIYNKQCLRSEYKARTDEELPVLTRYMEFDTYHLDPAEFLILVCYNAEQMKKEGSPIDTEWGVVAVLAQTHPDEEPMPPITMMRNALGVAEGGSGVPLDREEYMHSVNFWNDHAVVKHNASRP